MKKKKKKRKIKLLCHPRRVYYGHGFRGLVYEVPLCKECYLNRRSWSLR